MPSELKSCLSRGSNTTLMVWADLDHDMQDGDALKEKFWRVAQSQEVTRPEFDQVVFVFAKDRLENWIEFLSTGKTDESREGSRVKHNREVTEAAKTLAERCRQKQAIPLLPPSLQWSCRNWKDLVGRMSPA